jgi:catechol-2,3-dioxygenase
MRVSGLLHYGLQIPSLEKGHDFFSQFGLSVAERDHALVVRCDGRDQDQTVLHEGPDKRLHHVAFAIPLGTGAQWQAHLERQQIALHDAPDPDLEGGVWFQDPDRTWVNLREQELAPPRPPAGTAMNLPGSYERIDEARWGAASEPARPRRLGHMLVFSSDNERSERFYASALGLRLSDKVPGLATFMNAGPGDHHVFGFIQSDRPGLHHSSWEVENIDQLAIGAQTMAEAGHRLGWGLGRHSLGSNLFHYLQDPWGSWIEYFADIDQITEQWEAREWDTPPAVWCPTMPGEFLHNLEPRRD